MFKFHTIGDNLIAELTDTSIIISETQDGVDLLGELVVENCSRIIIYEKNLHPDFFRLHTGLAGDILQKFSNYRIRLAIIGHFSKFTSSSLQDFIRESNRGRSICFVSTLRDALDNLSK
jgi:hypothetical protein